MTEDYLMDKHLFTQFCGQMYAEMLKHKDEKMAMTLSEMEPVNVYSVGLLEIKKRLQRLENVEPELIMKEDVHMANYLFFMWVKMKELLEVK